MPRLILLISTIFILISSLTSQLALSQEPSEDIKTQLNESAEKLQHLAETITDNTQQRDALVKETFQLDKDIGILHKKIASSRSKIIDIKNELREVEQKSEELNIQLLAQRDKYKDQLKSAYKLHSTSQWKFLLNQTSLQNVGRNTVIYDYLHRDRLQNIETMAGLSEQLVQNKSELIERQEALERLNQQHKLKQAKLSDLRARKQQSQGELTTLIDRDQQRYIEQENEHAELKKLLQQITVQQQELRTGKFKEQLGKLPWPIQGKMRFAFGQVKAGVQGNQWTGVSLAAKKGTEIRSVYAGEVIFADWFDHYGWLMIIDHGDEYMTLYAHAEGLYKSVGDYVKQGELIAVVGDSGDTAVSNLYFEIRRQGAPVDPAKWCSRS